LGCVEIGLDMRQTSGKMLIVLTVPKELATDIEEITELDDIDLAIGKEV